MRTLINFGMQYAAQLDERGERRRIDFHAACAKLDAGQLVYDSERGGAVIYREGAMTADEFQRLASRTANVWRTTVQAVDALEQNCYRELYGYTLTVNEQAALRGQLAILTARIARQQATLTATYNRPTMPRLRYFQAIRDGRGGAEYRLSR